MCKRGVRTRAESLVKPLVVLEDHVLSIDALELLDQFENGLLITGHLKKADLFGEEEPPETSCTPIRVLMRPRTQ